MSKDQRPDPGSPERNRRQSICRLCVASCGVEVQIRGAEVISVEGDRGHPVSAGYTCSKGRGLAQFLGEGSRVNFPRVRGIRTSWAECLDDLGGRLRGLVETSGADAVGRYVGTAAICDFAGATAARRFIDGLGSRQCYSTVTVDIAPLFKAAELVTGFAREVAPMWDPEDSPNLCVIIGSNPVVSHGYWNLFLTDPIRRLRAFTHRGGRLWVVDPHQTETAALASEHLRIRPDTDAFVLAWLVRELLIDGAAGDELRDHTDRHDVVLLQEQLEPFTLDVVSERCGVTRESLERLLADVRSSGPLACVTGTGVTFGRNALLTEWLRWALLIVTGSLDRPGGMRFRTGVLDPLDRRPSFTPAGPDGPTGCAPASRPGLTRWLNEYPCAALVDEIEAGNLRGLLVMGGNPLIALPDPDRTVRAFRSLDVLAVADVVESDLSALATHVLPVASLFEHDDLLTLDRGAYVPAVLSPAYERRPQWWIVAQLAERLGLDIFPGLALDSATDRDVLEHISDASGLDLAELVTAGPHGVDHPRHDGWVRERLLLESRWRIAPPQLIPRLAELMSQERSDGLKLTSRRVSRSMNSVAYSRGPADGDGIPDLRIHPQDAREHDLEDGDLVDIVSEFGKVRGVARLTDRVAAGVVGMTHGLMEGNVARLTSAHAVLDPLTGQPVMTGLHIRLQRVADPAASLMPDA